METTLLIKNMSVASSTHQIIVIKYKARDATMIIIYETINWLFIAIILWTTAYNSHKEKEKTDLLRFCYDKRCKDT